MLMRSYLHVDATLMKFYLHVDATLMRLHLHTDVTLMRSYLHVDAALMRSYLRDEERKKGSKVSLQNPCSSIFEIHVCRIFGP